MKQNESNRRKVVKASFFTFFVSKLVLLRNCYLIYSFISILFERRKKFKDFFNSIYNRHQTNKSSITIQHASILECTFSIISWHLPSLDRKCIPHAYNIRRSVIIKKKTGRRRTAVVRDVDKVGSSRGQFLQIGASGSVMCDDIGHVTNMVTQLCWSRAMHFRCDLYRFRANSRGLLGENALLLLAVESGSFRWNCSLASWLRFECDTCQKFVLICL